MTEKRTGLGFYFIWSNVSVRINFNSLVVWMLGTLDPLLRGFLRTSLLLTAPQP